MPESEPTTSEEEKDVSSQDAIESQEKDTVRFDYEEESLLTLRKILGSCSINFLFGAGVNGRAFPSFGGFSQTINHMHEKGLKGDNIETALAHNTNETIRSGILDTFVYEYNGHCGYSLGNESIINLKDLLINTSRIVGKAENRHPESKRINIFTLNYDRIVEEILEENGLFNYIITQEKSIGHLSFNVIGYDTLTHAFVPTFCVYKLHGSVATDRKLSKDNIVFPGQDKLGSVISHFYETLFAMKGELLKKNSVLFVIGYSGGDDHVNGIISDALTNGLTVYWLQYKSIEKLPPTLANNVVIVPPQNDEKPQDTTKTLGSLLKRASVL